MLTIQISIVHDVVTMWALFCSFSQFYEAFLFFFLIPDVLLFFAAGHVLFFAPAHILFFVTAVVIPVVVFTTLDHVLFFAPAPLQLLFQAGNPKSRIIMN